MAETVLGLDWLLERKEAPVVGKVELLGRQYKLRGVNVLEDMLITQGAVMRFLEGMPSDVDEAQAGALVERSAAALVEMRGQVYKCIGMLVPEFPVDELERHFPRLSDAQQLFGVLAAEARRQMSESVKKNSVGAIATTATDGPVAVVEPGKLT